MKNPSPPKYAVTYGRLNFYPDEEGLETLFIDSSDEVKDMARQFIAVIPDDLADYKKDIKTWDGSDQLLIVHQDDDSFYFSATPITTSSTPDLTKFSDFVSEYEVDGDNEEDEEDEDEEV